MAKDLWVNNQIMLYGPVGGSYWDDAGFTDEDVLAALAHAQGDIEIRLNSPGGQAFQGAAIYNALKAHDGQVTVYVDALAASAASLIAMAADTLIVRDGALVMIHDPLAVVYGNRAELRKEAELLDKLATVYAEIYHKRMGQDQQQVLDWMAAETWFTASEAIALGFAQAESDPDAPQAAMPAFPYASFYRKPPKQLAQASIKLPGEQLATFRHASSIPKLDKVSPMPQAAEPTTKQTPEPSPAPSSAPVPEPTLTHKQLVALVRERCPAMSLAEQMQVLERIEGPDDIADVALDVLQARAPQQASGTNPAAHVTQCASEKYREAVTASLAQRAGLEGGQTNEFSAMSLREMAGTYLERSGIGRPGNVLELVSKA